MKSFIFAVLIGFSVTVYADDFKSLPSAINCVSQAKSQNPRAFTIRKLNTAEPTSSLRDTSLLETEFYKDYLLNISFSNECDNAYGLVFFKSDLVDLKSGKLKRVKAMLNYFDVELAELLGEAVENPNETVAVTCTLSTKN